MSAPSPMPLQSLLDGFDARIVLGEMNQNGMVRDISLDSRELQKDSVFVALPGRSTHGLNYASSAIEAQVSAVLIPPGELEVHPQVRELLSNKELCVIEVPALREQAGAIAARLYGHPAEALVLVAVTGTDGKTSICRFVAEALTRLGMPCGYVGTLGWGMQAPWRDTGLTTPDAVHMQGILAALRDQGAQVVAIEASSHGLAEGRLDMLPLRIAVLSNFGRDHLDYHGTEANYRAAKARLFDWPSLDAVVLNRADALGRELAKAMHVRSRRLSHCVGYRSVFSGEPTEVCTATHRIETEAHDIQLNGAGLSFTLRDNAPDRDVVIERPVKSALLGRFNVDNLLACHGVLRALGHSANDAVHALESVQPVPGRMEAIRRAGQPVVIVDYAHNPHALEAALRTLREHTKGRLFVVFGCGGDRDAGKRPLMGRAAEIADVVIITDDNPRSEDPAAIRQQALEAMRHPERVLEVPGRAHAIARSIELASVEDTVLIAGKGHEDYQLIGSERLHFSDREQVMQRFGEVG